MNGQFLMNRAISVEYAFKGDGKSERHGTAAERLLAAQARKNNALPASAQRPPTNLNALAAFGPNGAAGAVPGRPLSAAPQYGAPGPYQGQFAGVLAAGALSPGVAMGMGGQVRFCVRSIYKHLLMDRTAASTSSRFWSAAGNDADGDAWHGRRASTRVWWIRWPPSRHYASWLWSSAGNAATSSRFWPSSRNDALGDGAYTATCEVTGGILDLIFCYCF